MTSFLDIALSCLRRGWHVFPCWPESKKPLTAHGWHDATLDEGRVREWWNRTPNANVAIACGPSNLAVLDVDHGLNEDADALAWTGSVDLPATYTVRTGRRPEMGLQFYFEGAIPDVGEFELKGCSGQVKSAGGYVMAAGSIHPDTKKAYIVKADAPLAATPGVVWALQTRTREKVRDDGGLITENRNVNLTSIAGKLRNIGLSEAAIEVSLLQVNADRCVPPLDDEEVRQIAKHAGAWELPQPDPVAVIGTPKEPRDWRLRYLTLEQVRDAQPTSFFIDGFLAIDSITALAAPVGQRKSLIALNVAHALCTGEPLFDYFKVVQRPERVVYLCPEMGLCSFSTRLKDIGLLDYVGRTLYCQTMDDDALKLAELGDELPGAVVIIDTLTRFVDGDQNSSADMAKFAQEIFRLKRAGATILLLHHSVKGASNGNTLTLDSAMRGSTELAAFVTSVWATKLVDPEQPYASPSQLANVKQRDYESKPFHVTSGPDCRLHIVGEPGSAVDIKKPRDVQAEKMLAALLKDSPDMGINKLQEALKAAGCGKGGQWVRAKKAELRGTGVVLRSA